MTKTTLKVLAIVSGNAVGAHIGRAFPRKAWEAAKAAGYVTGGETEDAALTLTEKGSAALMEAL